MATRRKQPETAVDTPPTPRAIRTLVMGFGPMSFSVGLAPVRSDRNGPSASYVCEEHRVKVHQRYWCEEGQHLIEREVDGHTSHMPARGWEYGGEYVVIPKDELHELEDETNQSVEFTNVVDTLDPVWFQNSYLLWPRDDPSARAYDILAATLQQSGRILLGTVKLWKKTQMIAVRWSPATATLVMHFCAFNEQMRWPDVASVSTGIANRGKPDAEMVRLVDQFMGTLKHGAPKLKDEYAERLYAAIERTATGGVFEARPKPKPKAPADLDRMMDALRAEVERHSKKKPAPRKRAATPKRTTTRKART